MFDLTKEVQLNIVERKLYRKLRTILFIVSAGLIVYLFYLIIFPVYRANFSFPNPNSNKNSMEIPRGEDGIDLENGFVNDEGILFDAVAENFSQAVIKIRLDRNLEVSNIGDVRVKKSYKSFLFPEGERVDYSETFSIGGISDGSLVAYGVSAYVASENKLFPIINPETFVAQGYQWEDLTNVGPDLIASFERQKLFRTSSPHPNGTILLTDENRYFLVNDGEKHIISPEKVEQLPKRNPILVSEKSLEMEEFCELKKVRFRRGLYECSISLENLNYLLGINYQFETQFNKEIKINTVEVKFSKEVSWENFRSKVSEIITRIISNYVTLE